MLANSVTGQGKVPSQMPRDSDEYQKGVVLVLDVEDSTMPPMPEVNEVIVAADELATSKVMEKYETLGTGIAKVLSRQLYRLCLQLETLTVQIVQ